MPYVDGCLRDATLSALMAWSRAQQDPPDIRLEQLFTDESYFHVWAGLWREGEDVTVIEQDIVIAPDTLGSFDACREPWCAFGYEYACFGVYAGTGCVRFRKELIAATPRLWDEVATMSDELHPPRHWCRLDGWSQAVLHRHGFTQHVHRPPVGHVDTDVSHGCVHVPALRT